LDEGEARQLNTSGVMTGGLLSVVNHELFKDFSYTDAVLLGSGMMSSIDSEEKNARDAGCGIEGGGGEVGTTTTTATATATTGILEDFEMEM